MLQTAKLMLTFSLAHIEPNSAETPETFQDQWVGAISFNCSAHSVQNSAASVLSIEFFAAVLLSPISLTFTMSS